MRRHVIVAATLGAAGAAAILAVPSSARLVTAERLGAVTTIVATHSGTAELVLYDDATLSLKPTDNPDVSISGAGRLVGFNLVQNPGSSTTDQDMLTAFRSPAFAGGGMTVTGTVTPKQPECTNYPNDTVPLQSTCPPWHPTSILLHEGFYHLVVLTDGAPLRITLHLHGQHLKRSKIHLQRAIRTTEEPLAQHESIGSSTLTFGNEIPFSNATQVASIVAVRLHSASTFKSAVACARADNGAPPPYAYSPLCPRGRTVGWSWAITPPANPVAQGLFGVGVGGADMSDDSSLNSGIGGSITDTDGPTYLGGLGVWIAGETLWIWAAPGAFSA